MFGPGSTCASDSSSRNSALVSQRSRSTSSRCATGSTPPKPCRLSRVKTRTISPHEPGRRSVRPPAFTAATAARVRMRRPQAQADGRRRSRRGPPNAAVRSRWWPASAAPPAAARRLAEIDGRGVQRHQRRRQRRRREPSRACCAEFDAKQPSAQGMTRAPWPHAEGQRPRASIDSACSRAAPRPPAPRRCGRWSATAARCRPARTRRTRRTASSICAALAPSTWR